MSESKSGPFDASLETLRYNVMVSHSWVKEDYEAGIRVLEAAGKVDKMKALDGLEALRAMMSRELFMDTGSTFQSFRALLEALPDKEVEEEPKRYRCESCGKDFDKKLFSHSRTEENMMGEPVEVECGPITEAK
jgi:hypothetical protein